MVECIHERVELAELMDTRCSFRYISVLENEYVQLDEGAQTDQTTSTVDRWSIRRMQRANVSDAKGRALGEHSSSYSSFLMRCFFSLLAALESGDAQASPAPSRLSPHWPKTWRETAECAVRDRRPWFRRRADGRGRDEVDPWMCRSWIPTGTWNQV